MNNFDRLKGDNCKKLVIHIASLKAVPSGGGIGSGINFLLDRELVKSTFQEASERAIEYIDAVKATGDSTWQDEELIAGEILERLKEKEDAIA